MRILCFSSEAIFPPVSCSQKAERGKWWTCFDWICYAGSFFLLQDSGFLQERPHHPGQGVYKSAQPAKVAQSQKHRSQKYVPCYNTALNSTASPDTLLWTNHCCPTVNKPPLPYCALLWTNHRCQWAQWRPLYAKTRIRFLKLSLITWWECCCKRYIYIHAHIYVYICILSTMCTFYSYCWNYRPDLDRLFAFYNIEFWYISINIY